jgi:hypothetical protein
MPDAAKEGLVPYARLGTILLTTLALMAATFTPASASTTTITSEADAFVLSGSPNANRGAATRLSINNDSKRSYFRFNLAGLPAGESVTSATFKVFTRSVPKCSQGAEVVRAAGDTWGESTITWNNQPGPTASALAQVTSWTSDRYISFNVTSAVSGTGAVSFVLRHAPGCTPTGDAFFDSREAPKKPQLVVETTPGPQPQCSDGVDNDGDGQTDFPNDPGCTDAQDNDEADPGPIDQCGVSNNHTICVTLPSSTLTGTQNIRVTNSPNSGPMFLHWVPNGGSQIYLRQTLAKDPVTNNYSFDWPTHKYLDATGVLRLRALSATATPVEIPVTLSNGNTSDYQRNPNDWQSYLPGPWTQGSDPVVAAVGDGASDEVQSNKVANFVDQSNPALALYLGDVYELGSHTELINNYGFSALDSPSPSLWGKFADVTQPALGDHELAHLDAWTDYWHGRPRFTKFNFGGVLFLDLDSTRNGGFEQGSAQYQFVQSALTSGAPACVIAYAHHPVLTGSTVNSLKLPMWQLLANNGADLYLAGNAHFMAEYQPLNADLQPGPGAHLIEMISGAGGHSLGAGRADSRQVFLRGGTPGAVFLTLNGAAGGGAATSISWQWKDSNGITLHSGSTTC